MPNARILAKSPSFAGHQTFAVRAGWLKKGLDAIQSPHTGGGATFTRDDALVTLGVGKNMVQSIRHWLLTTRFAEENFKANVRTIQPTDLGLRLFGAPDRLGWDPFLEDPATLWLLHWRICGPGSPAFTWFWSFNLFKDFDFTKDSLSTAIGAAIQGKFSKLASRETIERDVQCLLNTYVASGNSKLADDDLDCPLRSLSIIRDVGERRLQFQIGPKRSLPASIFVYALLDFWEWREASETLALWDITYAEGSPGATFNLDEDSVLAYLDHLPALTNGSIVFEDDPLGRAAVRAASTPLNATKVLEDYYSGER